MGVTLTVDDRDLIIGELKEGVRAIREHLRRQDDVGLARDQQLEINKREAIKAREEKEARDEGRFRVLDEKSTLTGGRVAVLEKVHEEEVRPVLIWHRDEAAKFGGRISVLEQAKVREAEERARAENAKAGADGESRGKAWMITKIVGLVVAIGGVLGWLGADKLSAILFALAVRLGHG